MDPSHVTDLLRTGQLAAAEAALRAGLSELPGSVADACRATEADDVRVVGWPRLDAALTRLVRSGTRVTAVGLDLSNHGDAMDGREWWDKEPLVEVAVYDDGPFPFSTATAEELRRAGERYAAPWTGRMLSAQAQHLQVHGLRRLNGTLLRESHGRAAVEPGWRWLHLRFQQAVADVLATRGLALDVPVLAGVHGVGPWLVVPHRAAHVSDHLAETERLLEEEDRRHRAAYEQVTEETVAELTELRESVHSWGRFNRGRRRLFTEHADARLAVVVSWAELPQPSRSIATMSDTEFTELMDAFRASRRPG